MRKGKNTIKIEKLKKRKKNEKNNIHSINRIYGEINMSYEDKIKELNLELPEARDPVGSYVASKQIGKMLFISGHVYFPINLVNAVNIIFFIFFSFS